MLSFNVPATRKRVALNSINSIEFNGGTRWTNMVSRNVTIIKNIPFIPKLLFNFRKLLEGLIVTVCVRVPWKKIGHKYTHKARI